MSVPFIQQNFLKYNKGKGFISGHVEALHAMPPAADKFTDKIAEMLIKKTGCAGIISIVSRTECDLNRSPNLDNDEGIKEYRKTIQDILEFLHILNPSKTQLIKPYLHLSFHGMKDIHYGPYAIEIGTLNGDSCSPLVKRWFVDLLTKKAKLISPEIKIEIDQKFIGDKSIGFHRLGDENGYPGYGNHFHTFQIELSQTMRRKKLYQIVYLFSEIISDFQTKFVKFEQ
jgi:hypothetical protein